MASYLYGLVPTSVAPPAGVGLHDAPVSAWPLGDGLAALRSPVPDEEIQPRRAHLMAHDRVLAAAMADGPVLPLRFGVVTDLPAEAVVEDLDVHDALDRMHRLAGHAEVQVLWTLDEDRALARVVSAVPEVRDPTLPAVDRGRTVAETLTGLAVDDLEAVIDHLDDLVVGRRPAESRGTGGARVALLVAAEDLDTVRARIETLVERAGSAGELRAVVGLPPYSFADLSVELVGA